MDDMVNTYKDMVYRLAYARVRNTEDAEDIFQEVFLRYLKKKPIFNDTEHEKAWFIKVTINCSKNHFRNIFRLKQTELVTEIMSLDSNTLALEESLQTLKEIERIIIHLYYYEGYSLKEISALLNTKESTTRMCLLRAKQKLKQFMEGEENNV